MTYFFQINKLTRIFIFFLKIFIGQNYNFVILNQVYILFKLKMFKIILMIKKYVASYFYMILKK